MSLPLYYIFRSPTNLLSLCRSMADRADAWFRGQLASSVLREWWLLAWGEPRARIFQVRAVLYSCAFSILPDFHGASPTAARGQPYFFEI